MLGEYTIDEATSDGRSIAGLLEETDLNNMNANGIQFSLGIGYYLK